MTLALAPYLFFDGTCADAMKKYAEIFGVKLELMRMGDAPMPVPPEQKERIMHASIKSDTLNLMASDGEVGRGPPRPGSVVLNIDTGDKLDDLERIFAALADGGTVGQPLKDEFWGDRFGMVTDRFGIQWMLTGRSQKP